MTKDEALQDLTGKLQARVTGVGLQSIARDRKPRIPAEMAAALAQVTLDWSVAKALKFDD